MSEPRRPDGPGHEVPGDTGAADIVGPTGEEMPVASHDEVDAPRQPTPSPRRGNHMPRKGTRLPR